MPSNADYDELLDQGRAIYPGVRIGRPARARTYWLVIAAMRALRLRWNIHVTGSEQVGPGPAILAANHLSAMDPVVAVMSHWWRVTAFTKVEVYSAKGAIFFRLMGRSRCAAGTRSRPRGHCPWRSLALARRGQARPVPRGHPLPRPPVAAPPAQRILIPVITSNPDVPVHAICTTYPAGSGFRVERWSHLPRLPSTLPDESR